jgi:hypothetical protein
MKQVKNSPTAGTDEERGSDGDDSSREDMEEA